MEKYGVDVDPSAAKTAADKAAQKCPSCGSQLRHDANVPTCPRCGTRPFEPSE